jgi:hypothetical protein
LLSVSRNEYTYATKEDETNVWESRMRMTGTVQAKSKNENQLGVWAAMMMCVGRGSTVQWGELEREVRTVSAPCVLPHLTCMCLPRSSQMTRDDRMQKRKEMTTYASSSESSVKRLLATLLNSPSDSSLWFRPLLWLGAGGMSSLGSTWEMSLVADFLRLLRPLNSLDMRRREVSLRPSSEL